MLRIFSFSKTTNMSILRSVTMQENFLYDRIMKSLLCDFCRVQHNRNLNTSLPRMKTNILNERRRAAQSIPRKDDITGEYSKEADYAFKSKEDYFPTADLLDRIFGGVAFKNLPIVHIKVCKNNVIFGLTNSEGVPKLHRSCGIEGFKNAKQGTAIAAQTTGISFALRAVKKGFKTARVVVHGLGPGRQSAIKGLVVGGLEIISLTDTTVDTTSKRPKKQKRL